MPDAPTLMAFLAAVLAMQAVPGPDTMLVVSRGVGQGQVVAVATALGAVAAGLVQLPLLAAGVASLVRSSPLAFDLLRYAGAAFLVWLGLRLLLRRWRVAPSAAPRTTARAAFAEGMVSNLTNPNVLVFMLAFLPQFVDPAKGSVMGQMLLFGAVQKLSGLLVLGGTAFAAGSVGDLIARRPGLVAWQERFAGAVMLALALRLVVAGDARGKA
jgi:threonine/homoserine/homoserine lactone efflux protein